jgi:hypothetical protein
MKKQLLVVTAILILVFTGTAQTRSGFNYQAVVRDTKGTVVVNSAVKLKVSILQGTENGSSVYTEEHKGTTNSFGLINAIIGEGTNTTGSFSAVKWAENNYFMKVEMALGTNTELELLGISMLHSVPYALHAESVTDNNDADADPKNEIQTLSIATDQLSISSGNQVDLSPYKDNTDNQELYWKGDSLAIKDGNALLLPKQDIIWDTAGTNIFYNQGNVGIGTMAQTGKLEVKGVPKANPDEIIFGVLNSSGDTVFAVYPGGVRINVDDTRVKASGSRGGFAVGGISASKGITNEYMRVTPDSVRIYVENNPTKASGSRGGFAVGGISSGKTSGSNYMYLEPENYFIGHESGSNLTTGLYNSALGYQSGLSISTGSENAFMGYQGGYSNQSGSGNLFLGYQTGYSNVDGNYNSFLGYKAGYSNTEGINNSFLGSFAGQNNSIGSYNIFVGDSSGFNNTGGANNSFIGTKAGFNNVNGFMNSFLGNFAGYSNTEGYANVFIGNSSGFSSVIAGGNVFIGNETGKASINGWNNVYIGTETGKNNLNGEGNVFLGYQTGMNNAGTRNVFLGNRAGMNQTGSDKLIIDNFDGDSTQVLIWGDLENNKLRMNANIGIGMNPDGNNLSVYNGFGRSTVNIKGTGDIYDFASVSLQSEEALHNRTYLLTHKSGNRFGLFYNDGINFYSRMNIDSTGNISIGTYDDGTEMLDVNGNARFRWVESGAYSAALAITSNGTLTTATSDSTMKKNIVPIDQSLLKVMGMNGVYFNWKNDETGPRKVGFIAQEMEKVLPEVVFTNPTDGKKGINYAELSAVLVGAIKEQQQQISNQQSEIDMLKAELEAIKLLLSK